MGSHRKNWAELTEGRDVADTEQADDELVYKNALLEAQSETSMDGILVVDREGKTVLANRRFAEMWNIPHELMELRDDRKMVSYVLSQLKDPRGFVRQVDHLYAHTQEKSRDEIQFKDGRVFERYSAPLIDANHMHRGRIWYFHDITNRVQLERKLGNISSMERETLWRNLHDGVCQEIVGARLLVMSLRQNLSAGHPAADESVADIEKILGDALASLRHVAQGLEPLPHEPDSLALALAELASSVHSTHKISCRFASRKLVPVRDADVATQLFLIAREAVSNAVRHAQPAKIVILLSERNRALKITVRDDGPGFSTKHRHDGMGLRIMQNRAGLIGASLSVKQQDTGGTIVTCLWPETTGSA